MADCLRSVEEQVSSVDIEVILIDDGSTDGSKEICNLFLKRNGSWKYFYKTNKGLGSARNQGMSHGEYLITSLTLSLLRMS